MAEEEGTPARRWIAVALAALATIWGTQYLVIRVAREETSPELAVVLRFAVVAITAQLLVLARKERAPAGALGGRIAIGVCQGASMLLLYRAERDIESAWASLLMATSPFFVVLFALPLVPDERPRKALLLALLLGFAGAFTFVGPLHATADATPIALLVAAAALAGAAKAISKRFAARVPPVVMLRDLGVVVVVVVAPFAIGAPLSLSPHGALAHVYLGLVASALATGVYFWLLRHLAVTRLAYLPFVSGAIGVVAGVVAGERLPSTAFLGAALVAVGGVVLLRERRSA